MKTQDDLANIQEFDEDAEVGMFYKRRENQKQKIISEYQRKYDYKESFFYHNYRSKPKSENEPKREIAIPIEEILNKIKD